MFVVMSTKELKYSSKWNIGKLITGAGVKVMTVNLRHILQGNHP